MSDAKIIDIIAKLKAKADSTDSEAEAAAFMAKVNELLAEHNIEMADVMATEMVGTMVIDQTSWKYAHERVDTHLAVWTARLYFCDVYKQERYVAGKKTATIKFVGRRHNVDVAIQIYEYLAKTVTRLNREYNKKTGATTWAFRRGAIMKLASRMAQMIKERENAPRPQGGGNALVLFNGEFAAVQDFMNRTLHLEKARKSPRRTEDSVHYTHGQIAGNSISLSPQVGGSEKPKDLKRLT